MKNLISRGLRSRFSQSRLGPSSFRRFSTINNVKELEHGVRVSWNDGHVSDFHSVWLVDHDPKTIHETSLQRQLDSAALDLDIPPPSAKVENAGDQLRVQWSDREITFDADWLRHHCYDTEAQQERKDMLLDQRKLWFGGEVTKNNVPTFLSKDLLHNDESLVSCLQNVLKLGVVLVKDMPSSAAETEVIVRRIGPPRETFYGGMWDTAPKNEADINDTAYTKDGLHPHTDLSYLLDSGGLQLFNCVAQSIPESGDGLNEEGEIEGATKLVDGFKVVEAIKRDHPETYEFFVKTPLKWHCIENGVHVKAWAPVISFEPGSKDILKQFRYNSYDLSPVDYLAPDQMLEYYKHTKILNEHLRNPKFISYLRLNVGEMIIIDNHRVCHGRTAFSGFRNMVGCYIGVDDWKSTLRSSGFSRLINDE